jgi:hypothetical protein
MRLAERYSVNAMRIRLLTSSVLAFICMFTSAWLLLRAHANLVKAQARMVDLPVQLEPGNAYGARFVASRSAEYVITLDLAAMPDDAEVDVVRGIRRGLPEKSPDIEWALDDDQSTKLSRENCPYGWDGYLIGRLTAEEGREYTFRIVVADSRPELQGFDPRFRVTLNPFDGEQPYFAAQFARLWSGVFAIASVILGAISILLFRNDQRRDAQTPHN